MSETNIPSGTYPKEIIIGRKPQETQPIYVAPEPTGDELLDEIMELQAFRAHREREQAYEAYRKHHIAMMSIGKNMVYASTHIVHLSKAKAQTVSHVPE